MVAVGSISHRPDQLLVGSWQSNDMLAPQLTDLIKTACSDLPVSVQRHRAALWSELGHIIQNRWAHVHRVELRCLLLFYLNNVTNHLLSKQKMEH